MNQAIYKAQMSPDSTIPSRVRGLAPVVGMHGIAELADEILTPGEGQVRALIMTGGNPVAASADGTKLAGALAGLDLLVSIDLFQRESHVTADWLIPGDHFLERDDLHVGIHALNDRPFIQSARAAVPRPDGVWPEWQFFKAVADAMGLTLFGGKIDPHPDSLARNMLAVGGQVTLEDIRSAEHGLEFGERRLGHLWAYLRDHDVTVRLCPDDLATCLRTELANHRSANSTGGYQIISRRRNGMMNSWLAETSGNSPTDSVANEAEISRQDAARDGISDGDILRLRSKAGEISARAKLSHAIRPGVLVLAQGWGSPLFDPENGKEVSRRGNERNKLVSDLDLDPLSAVPRLNGTWVEIVSSERA
jgi:formate dehydrogenase